MGGVGGKVVKEGKGGDAVQRRVPKAAAAAALSIQDFSGPPF